MNQSAVLRASYEKIYKNLAALSEETKLFLLCGGDEDISDDGAKVILGVSDVCQLCPDKNGEKVEENEMIFEVPARLGCVLFLTVISKAYPALLETAGLLIQYFKDNNYIQLEDYKWHGDNEGKIFIEPVIRKPEPSGGTKNCDLPYITLKYTMEMSINSQKGTPFRRVEKREIKGSTMNK
jgi:hypothetical protein